VHLPEGAEAIVASVVGGEPQPLRPPDPEIQAQRAGDHRVSPVGGDDEARAQDLVARAADADTDHAPILDRRPGHACDPNLDAARPGMLQEHTVEDPASDT
jgi:hypothetical protein